MGAMTRALALASLVIALHACRDEAESTSPLPSTTQHPPPTLVHVAPDQLSAIEVDPSRDPGSRFIRLERTQGGWMVTSPVRYRANATAVEPMVAALAELEVVAEPHVHGHTAEPGVTGSQAIEVRGYAGGQMASRFWVGHGQGSTTFVRVAGDDRVLTVRGRCRRVFDKSLDELRDPVITRISIERIEEVVYRNAFGELTIRASGGVDREIRFENAVIRNFNSDRANKNVAVIAGLLAKGFADESTEDTGLNTRDTAHARIRLKGGEVVEVWVGARTSDGKLYVRTSESAQVYLISAHLESSLIPKREHFERTDAEMNALREHAERMEREAKGHKHQHAGPPATSVPPEMMEDLRVLAREQRGE